MSKIKKTMNYGMFESHQFNRNVDTAKLEKSMRREGWIDAYPMHVTRGRDNKLRIKAGHHRFAVAKKLGIPVKYVICDDSATIHELEAATRPWSYRDYLESHCRAGNEDYLRVKRYCDDNGIPVGVAVSMFGGNWAGSGNFQHQFKSGAFKVRDTGHAEDVADLVRHLKRCGSPAYNAKLLILALSKIIFVEEFDKEKFKRRAKANAHLLQKQANMQEYMRMIEAVYNRQGKDKIPLAFMADEAAKRRNAAVGARH